MHLYVLARGHQDWLNRWKNDLLAQKYPFKYDPDKPLGLLQLSVRPVELLEIVFPEDYYADAMATIFPNALRPRDKKYIWFLRKIMGLDKVDMTNIKKNDKVTNFAVSVTPVGIKKDVKKKNGIEMIQYAREIHQCSGYDRNRDYNRCIYQTSTISVNRKV